MKMLYPHLVLVKSSVTLPNNKVVYLLKHDQLRCIEKSTRVKKDN